MFRVKITVLLLMLLLASTASAGSGGGGSGGEYLDEFLWAASVYVTSVPDSESNATPFPTATYIRTFGVSDNATDGFNRDLDVPAPPLPPEEALDAYFPCDHEVVTRLATDVRPNAGSITWNLELTVPRGAVVCASWDVEDVPSGDTLTLTYGDTDIDMKNQSLLTFESGKYSLSITTNKAAPEKVTPPPHSSGGSGKSGGGGGEGSPEPQSNVEVKELSQQFVANGNRARFEFPLGVTCITYLEFDARKSLGKVTSIVEMLKERSSLTPDDPEGKVYKHLNIWVGNGGVATPENIGNPIIGFKVEKAWLEENDIPESSIRLWRYYNEMWTPLPAKKVGEDEVYVYFEAETPGFSPFAITGFTQEMFEMQIGSSGSVNSGLPSIGDNPESKNPGEPGAEKAHGPGIVYAAGLLAFACLACRRF